MAAKGNSERFPNDFMFQLNNGEKTEVVTNCDHLAKLKCSPSLPYAFTEPSALCGFELPDVRVVALLFQCPNVHSLLHPQPQTSTIAQ